MKTKIRVLSSFFVLLVACSVGQKRGRAREVLARLRRSAKRASDALDLLQSESDETTGSNGWNEARQAMASTDCPDWLVDYFRSQGEGTIDRR